MAVLVEGISVVVLKGRIDETYPNGWKGFSSDCPNQTLCADSDLARIGFMSPDDVGGFCEHLEQYGFIFQRDNKCIDLAVVDQLQGPTVDCDWLEFGHVELNGNQVAACHLSGSEDNTIITPEGWKFEESLSAKHTFVPNESVDENLKFLRSEDGMDVFLNLRTGKKVYIGRTEK